MPSSGMSLSQHLCVHQPGSSLTLFFWIFMETLRRCFWLNHWPLVNELNLQLLSSLQSSGGGAKNYNTPITLLAPLATNPMIRCFPKLISLTEQCAPLSGSLQEISRVLGALCQKQEETKYIFLVNHNIHCSTYFWLCEDTN